jgi:hypothetical protein
VTAANSTGVARPEFDGHIAAGGPSLGLCLCEPSYYITEFPFSDLMLSTGGDGPNGKLNVGGWYRGADGADASVDPHGYPLEAGAQLWVAGIKPAGLYTLLWTGTGDVSLVDRDLGPYSPVNDDSRGAIRRRTYNVGATSTLQIHCNSLPVSNIQFIYPGATDSTGFASIGVINPDWASKYVGTVKILRTLSHANWNHSRGWADRTPDGWSLGGKTVVVEATVTGFAPYSWPGPGPWFFTNAAPVASARVTTSSAHGLATGQYVVFSNTGTGPATSGGWEGYQPTYPIWVDSPTTFVIAEYVGSLPALPPGGGTVDAGCANYAYSPERLVQLCNVGGFDLWYNIPELWQDSDVTAAVTYFATHLNAGRKLYTEYSNEIWNPGFTSFTYSRLMGDWTGLGRGAWVGRRAGQINAAAHAAWIAVRGAGDAANHRRVFMWQTGGMGTANAAIAQAAADGNPFDLAGCAPYTGNEVGYVTTQAQADFLLFGGVVDTGAALDAIELSVLNVKNTINDYFHQTCTPSGLGMAWYEWEMGLVTDARAGLGAENPALAHPYPSGSNATIVKLFGRMDRHPRAAAMEYATYNYGAAVATEAACYLGGVLPWSANNIAGNWQTYEYMKQSAGDGSANLANLDQGNPSQAVRGYALNQIARSTGGPPVPALGPDPTPTGPPPKRPAWLPPRSPQTGGKSTPSRAPLSGRPHGTASRPPSFGRRSR